MDSDSLSGAQPITKEHRGLDYLLVAFALLVEVLALIFGFYLLAFGAAVMLWFAVRDYTKRWRIDRSRKWNACAGMATALLLLLIVMVPLVTLKRYMDRHGATAPAATAQNQTPVQQVKAVTQSQKQNQENNQSVSVKANPPKSSKPKALKASASKPKATKPLSPQNVPSGEEFLAGTDAVVKDSTIQGYDRVQFGDRPQITDRTIISAPQKNQQPPPTPQPAIENASKKDKEDIAASHPAGTSFPNLDGASHIIFDRCFIHGNFPAKNADHIAIVNSLAQSDAEDRRNWINLCSRKVIGNIRDHHNDASGIANYLAKIHGYLETSWKTLPADVVDENEKLFTDFEASAEAPQFDEETSTVLFGKVLNATAFPRQP